MGQGASRMAKALQYKQARAQQASCHDSAAAAAAAAEESSDASTSTFKRATEKVCLTFWRYFTQLSMKVVQALY